MAKKPLGIQVIEEGDERFLVKTIEDGSEERQLTVKVPRKKRPRRIDWSRQRAQAWFLATRRASDERHGVPRTATTITDG
jgi:hypothetical protein